LEHTLERLEQVPGRISAGNTRIGCQNFNKKIQYFGIFQHIV
jgi:hypothetical protein